MTRAGARPAPALAVRAGGSHPGSPGDPYAAAARKMAGKTRGRVSYVITTDGPEPADDRRHPSDHEHYVEKQLRAVAEPVLALLGQDFDDVAGSRKQLSLF